MPQQARPGTSTGTRSARLERELARERQQHTANQESKAGINRDEGERMKDARENFESAKVRR